MTIASAFTQTLTIQRLNASRDEIGGQVEGVASATPVQGYIEPGTGAGATASIEDLENRNTPIGVWTAYVPAGTDVTTEDRIAFAGHTLDIEGVEPFAHWGGAGIDHIRLRLREVR